MTWALDMDGVVWLGDEAIAGSVAAIARLRASGQRVCYVTNNSALRAEGYAAKLQAMGIEAEPEDVIHGGHAVAALLSPGESVLLCAGEGVREAAEEVGAHPVLASDFEGYDFPPVSAVVVGWRPDFDYRLMSLAVRAVQSGARLLAPSSDPLFPVADGFNMGGGAITAAVSYATGVPAVFAAKPYQPIVTAVRDRVGPVDVVVGDQPRTDGALAQKLGSEFALVLTGVATSDQGHGDIPITTTLADLAAVVDWKLGSDRPTDE